MEKQIERYGEVIYDDIPSVQESCMDSESDDEDIVIPYKKRVLQINSSSEEDDEVRPQDIAPVEEIALDEEIAPAERIIQWEKNGNPTTAGVFSSHFGPAQHIADIHNPTPYDMCCKFISKDIIDSIVFQTNLYAQQTGKRYTQTNETEIRAFIGINFIMGIVKLPSYRDYWSNVPYLHNKFISQLMTVNRFGWLLSHVHLNDNILLPGRNSPNFDKLYKVRPFLDKIQENFDPSCSLAIDESMIKFNRRSSIKQYLPKKPIKRGYKVWTLADKSGYCYRYEIYTGKVGNQVTKNLGEKVVNNLITDLHGKEHKIYFDNYFTSVNLIENLKSRQINACGVVVKTRKNLPNFRQKMIRGEYDSFVE